MKIERVSHRLHRPISLQINMDNLAQRVHASIGAARAVDPQRLAAKSFNGDLNGSLHGRQIGLGLEAVIGSAVIFDGQAITGH